MALDFMSSVIIFVIAGRKGPSQRFRSPQRPRSRMRRRIFIYIDQAGSRPGGREYPAGSAPPAPPGPPGPWAPLAGAGLPQEARFGGRLGAPRGGAGLPSMCPLRSPPRGSPKGRRGPLRSPPRGFPQGRRPLGGRPGGARPDGSFGPGAKESLQTPYRPNGPFQSIAVMAGAALAIAALAAAWSRGSWRRLSAGGGGRLAPCSVPVSARPPCSSRRRVPSGAAIRPAPRSVRPLVPPGLPGTPARPGSRRPIRPPGEGGRAGVRPSRLCLGNYTVIRPGYVIL
jgi:hypothetical protein